MNKLFLIIILFLFGCEYRECREATAKEFQDCLKPGYESLINSMSLNHKDLDFVVYGFMSRYAQCKKQRSEWNDTCNYQILR